MHMLDIAEPGYKYSIYEYQRDFFRALTDIQERGKFPVLCGGSGLYIDAATRNYRLQEVPRNELLRSNLRDKSLPELVQLLTSMKKLHNTTDVDSTGRAVRAIEIESYYLDNPVPEKDLPPVNPLYIGIRYERSAERIRITERLQERMNQGMVEEVRQLLESGIPAGSLLYYGLEYRYITRYIAGELDYAQMFSQLNTAIHQFAKRQRTWFRKMERTGINIRWINGELPLVNKLEIALQLTGNRE
jgi:tRNA dimethylallyltransferase